MGLPKKTFRFTPSRNAYLMSISIRMYKEISKCRRAKNPEDFRRRPDIKRTIKNRGIPPALRLFPLLTSRDKPFRLGVLTAAFLRLCPALLDLLLDNHVFNFHQTGQVAAFVLFHFHRDGMDRLFEIGNHDVFE